MLLGLLLRKVEAEDDFRRRENPERVDIDLGK